MGAGYPALPHTEPGPLFVSTGDSLGSAEALRGDLFELKVKFPSLGSD